MRTHALTFEGSLCAVVAISAATYACSPCDKNGCVVDIRTATITVVDADTRQPVPSTRVEAIGDGGAVTLEPQGCHINGSCWQVVLSGTAVTLVRFHVSAAGYVDTTLDIEIQRDECGDPISQKHEVALQKVRGGATGGSSEVPIEKVEHSCGQIL